MSPALAEPIDAVKANRDAVSTSGAPSTARAEASRSNGRLSHGPTSPEGKERSRRNGCKEGLTGAGIVLPSEAAQEVVRREAEFAGDLRPRNAVERELVRQMALGAWRSEVLGFRIVQHDARMNAARFANWEQDEQIAAAELGQKLADNPEAVVAQLRRSSAGCDWLTGRWTLLGNGLSTADDDGKTECCWTEADLALALNLLGRPVELRHLDHWKYRLELLREQARAGSDGAVVEMAEIISDEVAKLEEKRKEVWEGVEEPTLQIWLAGMDIDLGAEGTRLRRYEAAADRLFRSAWNKLERLRKEKGEPLIDRSACNPEPEYAPPPRPPAAPSPAPAAPASAAPAPQPVPQTAAPAPSQPVNRAADVVDFWIAGPPQSGSGPVSSAQYKTNPAQGRQANLGQARGAGLPG